MIDLGSKLRLPLSAALAALTIAPVATAQSAPPPPPTTATPIEPDGTVNVPGFALPPSPYVSKQARDAMPRQVSDPEAPMFRALAAGKAGEMRARIGEFMAPRLKHYAELFPVTRTETTIAGVPAVIVDPSSPIPPGNRRKVLLDLPGGGFVMGAAPGTGMLESIPLAAMAKVQIVSITYRQAPEFTYPAGSQDVTKVYRELLKTHRPEDIGIFGCSAGGMLTAESIGWLLKENLPLPGAIGIFCASADARFAGDSSVFVRHFHALAPREQQQRGYFAGADLTDPMVSPIFAPETLRRFPPTLIITATRAQDLSSAVNTHRELVKAGVDADLHVWDGLDHAFFYNIDLPESREAFDVMARFFSKHLKLTQ